MKRQNLRTVSLIVVTFTYLLIGAAIFGYLESEHEIKQREFLELIELIIKRKYNISDEDFTVLTTTIIKSVPHKAGIQWKFPGAFYFATTVVTTIGYGHSTPATMAGRSFCMIYALIGIPLGLVMFQSIGERLNTIVGCALGYSKRCFKAKNPEVTQTNLVMVVSVLSTILMTSMAAVFAKYERWDYFDALYYCFITLTTIGFGDYVALQKESALQSKPEYVALSLIFILFGLSVVSSAVNLLVLKFLTLNTEDERRDEQLRYTANLNPILLEGDVITSSSVDRHHNQQHQPQDHHRPPNEHQLAIYRPSYESGPSKNTMRRRMAHREAKNNSNSNNNNNNNYNNNNNRAALWPTKSISNVSSSLSNEPPAAACNMSQASAAAGALKRTPPGSLSSQRSKAIEQLLPHMLLRNSNQTEQTNSHLQITATERLVNLNSRPPNTHQRHHQHHQHQHPNHHPDHDHHPHHHQHKKRRSLHHQVGCSQEELCTSSGGQHENTDLESEHHHRLTRQQPYNGSGFEKQNECQQPTNSELEEDDEEEEEEEDDDEEEEEDDDEIQGPCGCELCLVGSIRGRGGGAEHEHELPECNYIQHQLHHQHDHEEYCDRDECLQLKHHQSRFIYDGVDLVSSLEESSLAAPQTGSRHEHSHNQQQLQLSTSSPLLSDQQQERKLTAAQPRQHKFQERTGSGKQQKQQPTADYHHQPHRLTSSAYQSNYNHQHHHHHQQQQQRQRQRQRQQQHHHHHQHHQPQSASTKTSESWLQQSHAYCDSFAPSTDRWRCANSHDNKDNASSSFFARTPTRATTSSCSCSWISIASRETPVQQPADLHDQVKSCAQCYDELVILQEQHTTTQPRRRRNNARSFCGKQNIGSNYADRKQTFRTSLSHAPSFVSNNNGQPAAIEQEQTQQLLTISGYNQGDQIAPGAKFLFNRMLSCSGSLLNATQRPLTPTSLGELGTLDLELIEQQQQQQQQQQPQHKHRNHSTRRKGNHQLTGSKSSGSLAGPVSSKRFYQAKQQQHVAKLVCKCCCEHLECIEHALAGSQLSVIADRKPAKSSNQQLRQQHFEQPLSYSMQTTPKSGAVGAAERFTATSLSRQHQLTSARSAMTISEKLLTRDNEICSGHVVYEKRPSDLSAQAQAASEASTSASQPDSKVTQQSNATDNDKAERALNVNVTNKVEPSPPMPKEQMGTDEQELVSLVDVSSGSNHRLLLAEFASNEPPKAIKTLASNDNKEESIAANQQ